MKTVCATYKVATRKISRKHSVSQFSSFFTKKNEEKRFGESMARAATGATGRYGSLEPSDVGPPIQCQWVPGHRRVRNMMFSFPLLLPLLLLRGEEARGMEMVSRLPRLGTITREGSPLTLSCSSSSPWFFCLWHSPIGGKQCAIQEDQV